MNVYFKHFHHRDTENVASLREKNKNISKNSVNLGGNKNEDFLTSFK